MKRKQLNHINNRQHKKLEEQFERIAENCTIENIHQLRVAYKKLRAFVRMVSQRNETSREIKIAKKIKIAYAVSGTIRDLQLQRQRILKAVKGDPEKPHEYLTLLQKDIYQLKPVLLAIHFKKIIAESRKKMAATMPNNFWVTHFKLFAQQKWAVIHSIITSGNFNDDNMHNIRKNLKDLFYNLALYKGVEHKKLLHSVANGKEEQYFEELIDELGNFQNKCMAVSLLKPYQLSRVSQHNWVLLEKIKKRWIKEKGGMKRLLVKQLKATITPLKIKE